MRKLIPIAIVLILSSCRVTTYYVVRHAEKESSSSTMTTDVPLSAAGKDRAIELKNTLQNAHIRYIFSTNYNRTLSTAEPARQYLNTDIIIYDTRDSMKQFIERLRNINDGNCLIVGHSNTVDDIVNQLVGKKVIPGDLTDAAYGDLFIVEKRGGKYTFKKSHFGK